MCLSTCNSYFISYVDFFSLNEIYESILTLKIQFADILKNKSGLLKTDIKEVLKCIWNHNPWVIGSF